MYYHLGDSLVQPTSDIIKLMTSCCPGLWLFLHYYYQGAKKVLISI